ncbi:MAG: DciA family protein [Emcibacter sp.]|nr:DciA family protein [Emcibacter sp.]
MSDNIKHKTVTIAEAAQKASHNAFRRYGFSQREILARWPDIVGAALADCSMPERLTFDRSEKRGGTLYIRVQGSMVPELQHYEAIVIERINSYYGYQAVERFIYRHGPVPMRNRKIKRSSPSLTDSQEKFVKEQIEGVKNAELQRALFQLGCEVLGTEKHRETKTISRFTRRGMGRQKTE